ncbi:hypothetical protein Efla_005416 [Eimeria flavescens]
MADLSSDPRAPENLKSCLDVIRDAYAAKPPSARVLLVLTLPQANPNFDFIEDGLRSRGAQQSRAGITGVGMFVAHFAVLFLEGENSKVMDCIEWLEELVTSRQALQGSVLFFSDYRTYKLMPSFWSLTPKDFVDMHFEEGEEDLTEDTVSQQVAPDKSAALNACVVSQQRRAAEVNREGHQCHSS